MPSNTPFLAVAALACVAAAPAPRDTLLRAAFLTHDKAQALALVGDAYQQTTATLAASPGDKEARLQQALAIGYRGQLKRSPADAKATRDALTALVRAYPRDPEVEIAYAGWHLTAVDQLGSFLARTVLGADKATGLAALDKAVALGGNRAFFPAFAAMIRVRLDPKDTAAAASLADRAAAAATPTQLDRVMQRAAQRIAVPLHAGNGAGAAALAKQLLPFGTIA
ncbi:hypothetical protein [Sphingomonas sp.]|uniref:hypothetical protein n=1 Tax=Sphingomonas sp. TaxID=28214 RepID=UPI003B002743